ncbi:lipocalin family protein [Pseudomonas sp.]|uniref:lipocalin family protein n=1 Tax=Pseudomonas sp. TaxID=306 RepID=UPI0028ADF226|nr:lipocalin family protein [Pseudomonas sp.]
MKTRTLLTLGCIAVALVACSTQNKRSSPPPATMPVDLERYQGTWYELARLPMFFQRKCVQSEAHYGLRQDGRIDVLNRCRDKDGDVSQVNGIAEPQVAGRTDKLWVRFDNWFSRLAPDLTKGHYWVLYHDADYNVALVGDPQRKYLWLLSRTPEVSQATTDQLLKVAHERGYDTSALIWRK